MFTAIELYHLNVIQQILGILHHSVLNLLHVVYIESSLESCSCGCGKWLLFKDQFPIQPSPHIAAICRTKRSFFNQLHYIAWLLKVIKSLSKQFSGIPCNSLLCAPYLGYGSKFIPPWEISPTSCEGSTIGRTALGSKDGSNKPKSPRYGHLVMIVNEDILLGR